MYQFTFANNPEWSRFYATGPEIQNYLKDVAWKYDVEKYVRFRHYFRRAEWDESQQQWRLELINLETNEVSDIFHDRHCSGANDGRLSTIQRTLF